jgi:hypothetical protein
MQPPAEFGIERHSRHGMSPSTSIRRQPPSYDSFSFHRRNCSPTAASPPLP